MTHSKLSRVLFQLVAAFALAACAGGCAMNAGEPTDEGTNSSESAADLRKAPVSVQQTKVESLSDEVAPDPLKLPSVNNLAPTIIQTDHVLGGSGQDEDGPRPHPWQPTPDNNTNSGTGGSSPSK